VSHGRYVSFQLVEVAIARRLLTVIFRHIIARTFMPSRVALAVGRQASASVTSGASSLPPA
jgi:hypothetical protein